MKFFHLSDLHIGKIVNNISMIQEQKNIFAQIIKYIKEETPAAVIIAGDIYDRAIPSVEAVRLFDDFLTELANENAAVLLIAGNHDSPERINYASRLLSDKQIFFCGAYTGEMQKVILHDEHGEVNFWLLPFVKPVLVRAAFENIHESDELIETYTHAVAAAINSSNIDYTKRNVLVSHQFYTSAKYSPELSDSEISPIGGLDAVDASLIENFDYAALGHLHGRQSAGTEHIRYAGSPLKYSFSEVNQKKCVTLVEICEKGNTEINFLPLIPLHDMRKVRGEIEALINDAKIYNTRNLDYLHVTLTNEEWIIDPMGKLRTVFPNIMELEYENYRVNVNASDIQATAEKLEKSTPYELFNDFFLELNGFAMTDEQSQIIRELLDGGINE